MTISYFSQFFIHGEFKISLLPLESDNISLLPLECGFVSSN